ncbi:putative ATP-binding protein [Nostocoides japonicum T1-X7]|uniref:Putative ATP-binding protein n=1 Tax=Nostocoides japonicum T1-X7 TaxID=1194083 RepID=A0A077LWX4_9MICO|nr:DUF3107 domain-containing protein [Tetrasphaera japonica]CCH77352.1 putative ATP-binding protein [Tetrasphaera japonica T1-X7]
MEVKIAVQNVARELEIETDATPAQVSDQIAAAIRDGGVLTLRDAKGRQVIVPGSVIGWVQIGEPEKARVGFGG